jgi:hypothetical protein
MSEQVTSSTSGLSTRTVPRTRGATSGLLLVVFGAWGALVPFIGPSFGWGWNTDQSWHWTAARGWYELLPGCVAAVAGLLMLVATSRVATLASAWLGALAGGWFIIGPPLVPALTLGALGAPNGGSGDTIAEQTVRALKELTYFYVLGALIIFLSAAAFGRLSVVSVRDLQHAERREAARLEAERETQRLAAEREAMERDAAELRAREAAEREAAERDAANRGGASDESYAAPSASPYGSAGAEESAPAGPAYGAPSGYGQTSGYGGSSSGYGSSSSGYGNPSPDYASTDTSTDSDDASTYRPPPENRG